MEMNPLARWTAGFHSRNGNPDEDCGSTGSEINTSGRERYHGRAVRNGGVASVYPVSPVSSKHRLTHTRPCSFTVTPQTTTISFYMRAPIGYNYYNILGTAI